MFGHTLIWDAHFLLYFCAIHAISSTSFWVGPLWFSALQLDYSLIHNHFCICPAVNQYTFYVKGLGSEQNEVVELFSTI